MGQLFESVGVERARLGMGHWICIEVLCKIRIGGRVNRNFRDFDAVCVKNNSKSCSSAVNDYRNKPYA